MRNMSFLPLGRVIGGALLAALVLVTSGAAATGAVSSNHALPDAPVADAAQRGDVDGVRALLRDGADVNAAQGDGMTALHWAAHGGDAELAHGRAVWTIFS